MKIEAPRHTAPPRGVAEDEAPPDDEREPSSRPVLTLGELTGLVGVVTVAAGGTAALALAQLGHHDGWLSVAIGLAVTAVLAGGVVLAGGRPRVTVDPVEIGLLAVLGIAAVFFFAPGSPYAYVDKDPGVYVVHGFAIAREGDVVVEDEVLEAGLRPDYGGGGRFPGLWVEETDPDAVTPQFYHLYSAMLATAADLDGPRGVFNASPALAVISVGLLFLATRRAAGTVAAVVVSALMVTSMMQVWQARYPSTEVLAQMLVCGTLLAAVLALERRWTPGAFVAGLLLGTGFLARPDGFLYIVMAAGIVGIAVALDRADRRVVALGLGLALTAPYALWNAYELRWTYSEINDVPALPLLAGACAALIAGGYLVRLAMRVVGRRMRPVEGEDGGERPPELLDLLHRWHLPLGIAGVVLFGAVLLGLYYRKDLFGVDYGDVRGEWTRTLDERNMRWLSLFITVPGLVVFWIGSAVLLLRRSSAALYALAVPAALLVPVYLWNARISMRLMWWVRRFVPAALPALLLLMALALAWALLHRRWQLRVVGAVATVALVVTFAGQSLPLRDHREMRGSWDVAAAISQTAGEEQGVFLFAPYSNIYDPLRNTGGAVWFIFDEIAAMLPRDYEVGDIEQYRAVFPDKPIYLVAHEETLPAGLPSDRFTLANTIVADIVMWDESVNSRPDEAITSTWGLTVWQLRGPAP